MQKQYVITVNVPDEISDEEMKHYIYDAVCTWKGCFNPEGKMFNADFDKMKVTRKRKVKKCQ